MSAAGGFWHGRIGLSGPSYELWTFQTAFRWIYPSVAAGGRWKASLGRLVAAHNNSLSRPPAEVIDHTLWDAVVLGTHLNSAGAVTSTASDPLAVFRAPWQTALSLNVPGNEADLLQRVVYSQVIADVAQVYKEDNTLDVLIHHRDTRPLDANHAFTVLLWRDDASNTALLTEDLAAFPAYVVSVQDAVNHGTAIPVPPSGWHLEAMPAGHGTSPLPVKLDARLPRAVSIDVNLSTANNFVMFLAFVGSDVDPLVAPTGLPSPLPVADLVTPADGRRRSPGADGAPPAAAQPVAISRQVRPRRSRNTRPGALTTRTSTRSRPGPRATVPCRSCQPPVGPKRPVRDAGRRVARVDQQVGDGLWQTLPSPKTSSVVCRARYPAVGRRRVEVERCVRWLREIWTERQQV